MAWYVLYTKPRNEKKVSRLLQEKGVIVYCPVQESIRQWSDRKKKIQEPIFKSYIFVKMDDYEADNVKVLTTPGAVRFLWWLGKPGTVREEEIEGIKNFLNKYKGADIYVNVLEGQEVAIVEGPLKENTGVVLRITGNKATLHIKTLGWNITAQVPVQSISPKK
ncbi:MAG: UpxY family transcription antiterminator [Flavipsychrobacter sp.]